MTEKRFNVFDVDGTVFLEDHKEGSYHIGEKENVDIPCLNDIADRLNTYADENEQLKSEIAKLSCANEDLLTEKRNWFVLSNEYGELYDKHEKKKEHQRVLENKIHRMRKSIHKLEWLAHHRNAELLRENWQLKQENKELRQDNDIKFWKLQCLQSSNNNQVMLFELSRVIQQGYEVSDKFKQYLDEIKEQDKEIREKHKRLFE